MQTTKTAIMKTLTLNPFSKLVLPALLGCSLAFSQGVASAEWKWSRANTPGAETLYYLPMNGSLESPIGASDSAKLTANEGSDASTLARNPADPAFSESAPNLGKALKLNPENMLVCGPFKSAAPLELTVSFWVKITEPGYLCSIQNIGISDENALQLGFKARNDGTLGILAKVGASDYIDKSVPCPLLDGTWHHFAVVLKPDPSGNTSKLKIAADGETLGEFDMNGVGPDRFSVTVGASLMEYHMERSGPGALCEIDELLVVEKALPEPNKPL